MELAITNPIVESRLFGYGCRPHVVSVYDLETLEWTVSAAEELEAYAFGAVAIWGTAYIGRERPVDRRYDYVNAPGIAVGMARLREHGFAIVGYIHARFCREAGMTSFAILDEIERHGWDGVVFDGVDAGTSIWATWDFVRRARRMLPGPLIDHCTIPPYGLGDFRGPWAELADYVIVNEGRPIPPDVATWRHVISAAGYSNAISLPKFPGVPETDELYRALRSLPLWLCSLRASRGGWFRMFKAHYWPHFQAVRDAWRREHASPLSTPATIRRAGLGEADVVGVNNEAPAGEASACCPPGAGAAIGGGAGDRREP